MAPIKKNEATNEMLNGNLYVNAAPNGGSCSTSSSLNQLAIKKAALKLKPSTNQLRQLSRLKNQDVTVVSIDKEAPSYDK